MRGLAVLVACLAGLAIVSPAMAKQPRLAPSDRAAIHRTLDILVNHAVKRKNVAASYDVVTSAMRDGMTRKQWSRGDIPVYPYPAAGRRFHKWTIMYRNSEEVAIELILAPAARHKGKLGQILFHVSLKPRRGRWLVDSFVPGATFAPVGKPPVVQAAGDFQATPGGQTYNRPSIERDAKPPRIGAAYIFIPFVLIGLLLAGLAGWGVARWIRQRRLDDPRARPPLSIRADGARARPSHRP
jgi:hypothetical protein